MKGTLFKKAPSALTALSSFSVRYLPLALMSIAALQNLVKVQRFPLRINL